MMSKKSEDFLTLYEKRISDAIKLEKQIFGNETSKDDYYANMKRGLQLEIRYGKDNNPIAFIAVYNRTYYTKTSEGFMKTKISKHLWLCGVLPEYRNVGLMRGLFQQCFSEDINLEAVKCKHEREYDPPTIISVHTYPDYYKDMVKFIKKYGFEEECDLEGKYKNRGRFVRYVAKTDKIKRYFK